MSISNIRFDKIVESIELRDRQHYGVSADIYSLGLVMYWMMNERTLPFLPHYPKIPTAVQKQEAQERRFASEPLPAPLHGSEWLKKIVLKACAFEPDMRYHSVRELASDIQDGYNNRKNRTFSSKQTSFVRSNVPDDNSGDNSWTLTSHTHPSTDRPKEKQRTHQFSAGNFEKPKNNLWKYISAGFVATIVALVLLLTVFNSSIIFSNGKPDGCTSLNDVDLSPLTTSSVTDMTELFWNCSSLTRIDCSGFDTASVKSMSRMFFGCSKLEALELANFNTGNVVEMVAMFNGCSKLQELDLSNFRTSKVTSFGGMFSSCTALTTLNISGFDTSQAENLGWMFSGCRSLRSLDLSHFNTQRAYSMRKMFGYCESLSYLNIANFTSGSASDVSDMFIDCTNLNSLVCSDTAIRLSYNNKNN